MKYFEFLNQIQKRLQAINGFEHDYLITDFLAPSKDQNSLIVKEAESGPEVLLCIEEKLLKKYENIHLPWDFRLAQLAELSIVIEELSHFNAFCSRMEANEKVSQLELEVQGEVDKFAVALDWLADRNEEQFKHTLFDHLFGDFHVGDWVTESQRQRYEDAHHIARRFCRMVLEKDLSRSERRDAFRNFFHSSHDHKLSMSVIDRASSSKE